MRELELRERKIKEIQSTGDRLLRDGHPARQTVEVSGRRAAGSRGQRGAVHGVTGHCWAQGQHRARGGGTSWGQRAIAPWGRRPPGRV